MSDNYATEHRSVTDVFRHVYKPNAAYPEAKASELWHTIRPFFTRKLTTDKNKSDSRNASRDVNNNYAPQIPSSRCRRATGRSCRSAPSSSPSRCSTWSWSGASRCSRRADAITSPPCPRTSTSCCPPSRSGATGCSAIRPSGTRPRPLKTSGSGASPPRPLRPFSLIVYYFLIRSGPRVTPGLDSPPSWIYWRNWTRRRRRRSSPSTRKVNKMSAHQTKLPIRISRQTVDMLIKLITNDTNKTKMSWIRKLRRWQGLN